MTIKTKIETILAEISAISQEVPESKQFGDFLSRAISASADRAALWDSRLSTAARLTVASSAMDYVSYFLSSGGDLTSIAGRLNRLVDQALEFSPLQLPEHRHEEGIDAPDLWNGPEGGPFTYLDKDYPLMLVRRPHLPGGNWTLFYSNIPISFGATSSEAAEKADALIELREKPIGRCHALDV